MNVHLACTLGGRLAWISDAIDGNHHDTYCLSESEVLLTVAPGNWAVEIAPFTYYAAKKREENPPRCERGEQMKKEIMRVWSGKGGRRTARGRYGASWAAREPAWPGAWSSG